MSGKTLTGNSLWPNAPNSKIVAMNKVARTGRLVNISEIPN